MKILEYLIEDNIISVKQAVEVLKLQKDTKQKVGEILIDKKYIDCIVLADYLGKQTQAIVDANKSNEI